MEINVFADRPKGATGRKRLGHPHQLGTGNYRGNLATGVKKQLPNVAQII